MMMRQFILVSVVFLEFVGVAPVSAQVYGDPSSLVDYWYRTYLGRPGDQGMTTWVDQLNQGAPPDAVLAGILGSPEYYARAGSTPEGFISRLYADILKRPATSSELGYWVPRMYTEDRSTIADTLLTQNPGIWIGSGTAAPPAGVSPGVIVTPGIGTGWYRDWNRDRQWDWDRRHGVYDYRRPYYQHYHNEHHDEHHGEHHH
jgi:hypothetical protein